MFKKLVQDVFGFKDDSSKISQLNQSSHLNSLEKTITEKATSEYGFFPNKSWVEKCMQIYSVSLSFKGIILCGPSCTGKTATLNVLIDALTELGKESFSATQSGRSVFQQVQMSSSHKIKRF